MHLTIALKKYLKKGVVKNMNEHEKIAKNNIEKAFAYIIGGYYNMLMDEELDVFDPEEVKEEIYKSAMVDKYTDSSVLYDRAPKEMKFAGADFCKKLIDDLFASDGDVADILQHFSRN